MSIGVYEFLADPICSVFCDSVVSTDLSVKQHVVCKETSNEMY